MSGAGVTMNVDGEPNRQSANNHAGGDQNQLVNSRVGSDKNQSVNSRVLGDENHQSANNRHENRQSVNSRHENRQSVSSRAENHQSVNSRLGGSSENRQSANSRLGSGDNHQSLNSGGRVGGDAKNQLVNNRGGGYGGGDDDDTHQPANSRTGAGHENPSANSHHDADKQQVVEGDNNRPLVQFRGTVDGDNSRPLVQLRGTVDGDDRRPLVQLRGTVDGDNHRPLVQLRATVDGDNRRPLVQLRATVDGDNRRPLVQFKNTVDLVFEDAYVCHRFAFDAVRQFEAFKRAAAYFAGYLIYYKTEDRLFVQYRVYWLAFISRVLAKYGHRHEPITRMSVEQFTALTLQTVYERLRLQAHTFTPDDGYKNVWGNRYWDFLHAATFCVAGDEVLTRAFANLMMNFHLVLVCGTCYHSYKAKDPLRSITVPIRETLDPITVVYNLHNAVNAEIGTRRFPLAEFCDKYACKMLEEYTRNYATVVRY